LLVLTAAILWGSLGIAGRVAFRAGVTPLEAAFYRAAVSFAILLVLVGATNRRALRIRPSDLGLFAAFGLVGIATFFVVYLVAISLTTVATAAILLYTAPVFVIALSAFLFREPLTRPKAAAVVLAFAGCLLVGRGYDLTSLRLNLSGVLAGLAAGLTYAMYSIFGKTAMRRYSPVTTLTYALGFGTVFLGVLVLATGDASRPHSVSGWMAVAYLALVTTLLAQGLYLAGLQQLEAGRASLIATVEPVVAAALGYLVLGEQLGGLQIVGGVLILSAVIVAHQGVAPARGS
jgi:drug/metabolite transporter (DMT)-like permease